MRCLTNADIVKMYAMFNKSYFNNKLPNDIIVVFEDLKSVRGVTHGETISGKSNYPFCVQLNTALQSRGTRFAAMVLLHEMVHVKLLTVCKRSHKGHGPKFHKEMLRLAKIKAFNDWW